jgi:hypothetical protein
MSACPHALILYHRETSVIARFLLLRVLFFWLHIKAWQGILKGWQGACRRATESYRVSDVIGGCQRSKASRLGRQILLDGILGWPFSF